MFKINNYIKLMIVITFLILSPLHAELNHQLPDNIDRDWWSQASQYIAESEYEIRWHSEYQSPNRAQNLRFSYYLDGFKVMPRVDEDMWSMAMKLTGFGRADAMSSFTGKSITIDKRTGYVVGNDVDIAFENSEKGMREDFVIQKKVLSQGELMLLFSVFYQNLLMEVERDEIHFVINEPGGAEILRYGDMEITDSQGIALDGYFKAIDENRFAIVVHDHDAVYPIVIDPLSSTPDWTAESN